MGSLYYPHTYYYRTGEVEEYLGQVSKSKWWERIFLLSSGAVLTQSTVGKERPLQKEHNCRGQADGSSLQWSNQRGRVSLLVLLQQTTSHRVA